MKIEELFGEVQGTTVTVNIDQWKEYIAGLDRRKEELDDREHLIVEREEAVKKNRGKVLKVHSEIFSGFGLNYCRDTENWYAPEEVIKELGFRLQIKYDKETRDKYTNLNRAVRDCNSYTMHKIFQREAKYAAETRGS